MSARTSPGWRRILRQDMLRATVLPAVLAVIDCWGVVLLLVLLTGVEQ